MSKILLVEDDISLIEGLEYTLRKNGFHLDIARTVQEAFSIYADGKYNLLLLDVTLPDGTGFQICQKVRQTSSVPIIFLTAADEEVNIVKGLDIGGDDYITKPFKLNELFSRIHAILRRTKGFVENNSLLSSNGIAVELLNNKVFKNGEQLELTAAEYRLICYLMRNQNIILTRQQILDNLWDNNGDFIDDNTLSVYIRRLRSKIEKDASHPQKLLTVRGFGYQWKDTQEGERS